MPHIALSGRRATLTSSWLKEVRPSCRFVWVYIPGILEQPRRWHPTFFMLTPGVNGRAGTVEVKHEPRTYSCGLDGRQRWREWSRTRAGQLAPLIRDIQRAQPYELGFVTDDFGAHIVEALAAAPSPIRPAFLVMSNPMLPKAAQDSPLFEVPGYVRSTPFPWHDSLDLWKLGFDPADRMVGEYRPKAKHLEWEAAELGALKAAVDARLSLKEWLLSGGLN